MLLEKIVWRVESRLFRLGRTLLQADEKSSLHEELDLALLELGARQADLARAEARRDAILLRARAHARKAAELPAEVESSFLRGKRSQALRQALELEGARRGLEAVKAELPAAEQTVWSLRFTLRQLRRRVDHLREALAARPAPRPRGRPA
jgi:hypothetical protein